MSINIQGSGSASVGAESAAGPNFGDCFAYALARYFDEPLLFKGDDFVATDIKRVLT